MSCFLMINSWAGEDQLEATEKIARVFRMGPEDADAIVDNLTNGNPWQFDHQISDQQSEIAEPYLQSLGFDVECIPVMMDDGTLASANRVSSARSKTFSRKNVKRFELLIGGFLLVTSKLDTHYELFSYFEFFCR